MANADGLSLAGNIPAEYGGGGLTKREQVVVAEEFARAGVPTGAPHVLMRGVYARYSPTGHLLVVNTWGVGYALLSGT